MSRLDAERFLEDLSGRYARAYTEEIGQLVVFMAKGDKIGARGSRGRLATVIAETMGIAEVLGASLALRGAARALREEFGRSCDHWLTFASAPSQTLLPRVTLTEAVQDMVDRTPITLRNAAERTAQRIAQLYTERNVVAFVNSAEQAVTERVQALISQAIREGIPEVEIGQRIVSNVNFIRRETEAWTESYARMAFRTNLNTAVTGGRFRQVRDPDIKAVIPCLRHDAVGDVDTRPNHKAADGMIFKVDNPAWHKIASPLGYN